MARGFVSHSDDPDLQRVSVALVRAGQRARELARSTGTGIAIRIKGELRVLEGTELDSDVQEDGSTQR